MTSAAPLGAARALGARVAPGLVVLLGSTGAWAAGQVASSSYDERLRVEAEPGAGWGPTGARLFPLALADAPGLRGSFACGDAAVVLRDPIVLEPRRDGVELALERLATTWFPSHRLVRWRAGELWLEERKFVTADDLAVVELAFTNRGARELDLELHVRGGATDEYERFSTRQTPLDLSGAAVVAPRSGRPLFSALSSPRAIWLEAEQPSAGDSAARVLVVRDASASACVDGFGARAGERLEYSVIVPPLAQPLLRLRYSNAGTAAARIGLELDGLTVGELDLPPARGASAWELASLPLASLRPGAARIALFSLDGSAWLRLDGLWLAERDEPPGELEPRPSGVGAFAGAVPEQLAIPVGEVELDGVRYALADPGPGSRPTVVALRGGLPGDPASDFPERVRLELRERSSALVTLHLLLGSVAPRGAGQPTRAATIGFRLDDGSLERCAWPGADALPADPPPPGPSFALRARSPVESDSDPRERAEWRALGLQGLGELGRPWGWAFQLSYSPPPGRFLRALELERGDGLEIPLLLAGTLETPRPSGRLPLLAGRTTLGGTGIELALTVDDAVLARTPEGERSVRATVSLAPGATVTRRAVLALGTRDLPTAAAALDAARDASLLARHLAEHERWFAQHVPAFECSDPRLSAAWGWRWCEVRRSLRSLDLPDFSLPVAYAGTCCAEHARVAPGAAARALRELRWLRDLPAAQGTLRALLKRQAADGLLRPVSPGASGEPEPHDLAAAALGVYAVSGSTQFLMEVLGLLERDFLAGAALLGEAPELAGRRREAALALAAGWRVLGDAGAAARLEHLAQWMPAGSAQPRSPKSSAGTPDRAGEIDALARALRAQGAAERGGIERLLGESAAEVLARAPGAPRAACSGAGAPAYADLVIQYVAGLVPRVDGVLELRPLVPGLEHFRVAGIAYRGRSLDVTWDRPDGRAVYAELGLDEGFTVVLDGSRAFHSRSLEPFLER